MFAIFIANIDGTGGDDPGRVEGWRGCAYQKLHPALIERDFGVVECVVTGNEPGIESPVGGCTNRGWLSHVPANHGLGLDDDQAVPPFAPGSSEPEPEDAVLGSLARALGLSVKNDELLAQG